MRKPHKEKVAIGGKRRAWPLHRFQTKAEDLSTKVPVYVPGLNLTVFAAAGSDPEAVRKKYLDQHRESLAAIKSHHD